MVPILRAGLGMVDGMLEMIPAAKSDISVSTVIRKLQSQLNITANFRQTVANREVFVVDPMLATGGSAITQQSRC